MSVYAKNRANALPSKALKDKNFFGNNAQWRIIPLIDVSAMKNKVDKFVKIKYYRILIIKILLLSLLLSTFMVIFSFNVELSDVEKSALLRWIDAKIDVNKIIVSYKNNVMGEKVFAAYYLYIHPIIALIIVVAEIALGNNSFNDDEYRDFIYVFCRNLWKRERRDKGSFDNNYFALFFVLQWLSK